jgi:hypothetical protein
MIYNTRNHSPNLTVFNDVSVFVLVMPTNRILFLNNLELKNQKEIG